MKAAKTLCEVFVEVDAPQKLERGRLRAFQEQ